MPIPCSVSAIPFMAVPTPCLFINWCLWIMSSKTVLRESHKTPFHSRLARLSRMTCPVHCLSQTVCTHSWVSLSTYQPVLHVLKRRHTAHIGGVPEALTGHQPWWHSPCCHHSRYWTLAIIVVNCATAHRSKPPSPGGLLEVRTMR